jgi:hypothetical protein
MRTRVPTEVQLGGTPGYPIDVKIFRPLATVANMIAGRLDAEIREQVEMWAELLPAARRSEFDCLLCRKPFREPPAVAGWLSTLGGSRRALFGACQDCDGPDVEERMREQLGAVEMAAC